MKVTFKKLLIFVSILGLLNTAAYGQEAPLFNQFFFNPFLYNPAFVAQNGSQISLAYREQWLGVSDAPSSAVFTYQQRLRGNGRLGLTINHDEAVSLQRNSALLTYAYNLPLTYGQSLTFALSAGLGRFGLDMDALDLSDPVLSNAASNSYFIDGSFGFLYTANNFNLSLGFNNLFDANPYRQDNLENLQFTEFQNFFASASYSFLLSELFSARPYVFYNRIREDFEQLEGGLLLKYKEKIWAGGAYRYQSNPSLFFGFNLFKNVNFSYSYEFAPIDLNGFQGGSHELMFSYRFRGNKKQNVIQSEIVEAEEETFISRPKENQNEAVALNPKESQQSKPTDKKEDTFKKANQEDSVEVTQTKQKITNLEDQEQFDNTINSEKQQVSAVMKEGYYVVFGVYEFKENAERFVAQEEKKGHSFAITKNQKNELYYIVRERSSSKKDALALFYSFNDIFSDIWIYFHQ